MPVKKVGESMGHQKVIHWKKMFEVVKCVGRGDYIKDIIVTMHIFPPTVCKTCFSA